MDTELLKAFLAVVDEMHVTRAAARLGIAQPRLTLLIRRLEAGLGFDLFTRTTRSVRITPAGEAYARHARRILADLAAARAEGSRIAAGHEGHLRVGFVAPVAHALLPAVLRRFRMERPDVTLDLRAAGSARQFAELVGGGLDVGYARPPVEGEGLATRRLYDEPLVALIPDGHRLAGWDALRLSDLAGEPLILYPADAGPSGRPRIDGLCRAAGFDPRVAQEATDLLTIAGLVAGGVGVALVIGWPAIPGLPGIATRALGDVTDRWELLLVTRADTINPAVSPFVNVVEAVVRGDRRQEWPAHLAGYPRRAGR